MAKTKADRFSKTTVAQRIKNHIDAIEYQEKQAGRRPFDFENGSSQVNRPGVCDDRKTNYGAWRMLYDLAESLKLDLSAEG